MSLIGSRIRKWAPFVKDAVVEKEVSSEQVNQPEPTDGPPLVLLVPDASGRASFQFNSFPNAATAIDYINVWFRAQQEAGVIAFWALADEPVRDSGEEQAAERVVLIRDAEKTGIVYLFSFVDNEGAQDFVRSETESGIDLDSVLVYWAAPIRIDADDAGSVRLTPEFPPAVGDPYHDDCIDQFTNEQFNEVPEGPQPVGWARVIGRNVQISQQVKEPLAAATVASIPIPVKPARTAQEPLASIPAEVAVETPQPVGWARVIGRNVQISQRVEEPVAAVTVASHAIPGEPVQAKVEEPLATISAETAVVEQVAAVQGKPARSQPTRQSRQRAAPEPSPLAEPVAAPDETAQPPSWFTESDGHPPLDGDTWRNDGFHDLPAPDLGKELEKVLNVKRWELQEGPFRGFQSPPGRF